ncbi:MAG TPA: asparagine synthase (glutamine-hydrolyzing) [Pyrinomonadaceae bacterium]|nr:asparagine synthase (glutamine-hydrolyzing) [Pyrinomonadaceae bacterium]
MCGICGVVDWSGAGDAASLVKHMSDAMVHRGPDDAGSLRISDRGSRIAESSGTTADQSRTSEHQENGAGISLAIGMRRLSIIDVEGGHQPIYNETGDIGAVLNGEIYNFQSLRSQLQDRGHKFHTRADSEVVVHAFQEWGPQCVERFEGMFAIAVWDGRKGNGKVFLARDRLGIKPLYYHAKPTRFLFASEVRALLASGVVPRRLSRPAVESYLLFGSVGEPMTLVEDVYSLPPGHRMMIDLDSDNTIPSPERYWTMSEGSKSVVGDTDRITAAKQVRELLQQSVRKHLIADVPVGVFLSSGIDSTALAALAAREASGVHTFTVAFPEKEFSEAAMSRRTANTLGTIHDEVTLSGDQMLTRLGDAVAALDQPTMDGINTYFVSWSARQAGLKVALSGLGGDELFGGYQTFSRTAHFDRMANLAQRFPDGMKSMVAAAGSAAGRFSSGDAARKLSAIWKQPQSLPDPFYFGRALFTPPQVAQLVTAETNGHGALWREWLEASAARARSLDSFAAVSCMEAESYMVSTLLRDTDSMSMAHSLEVRVPFLDHPLVEYVTRLPRELKFRKGRPKSLLIDAVQELLPAEVVNQSKRGFTFPWAEWLRGPLKSSVDEGLSEMMPALRNALDSAGVQGVWRSYLDGKTSWSRPWSLYVLNEWCKAHL